MACTKNGGITVIFGIYLKKTILLNTPNALTPQFFLTATTDLTHTLNTYENIPKHT
jgi:hypothetical protein